MQGPVGPVPDLMDIEGKPVDVSDISPVTDDMFRNGRWVPGPYESVMIDRALVARLRSLGFDSFHLINKVNELLEQQVQRLEDQRGTEA